ncbi:ATPase [Lachnospiraceae bacterium TWA4]|nr:ATPase [Lachnospiraceae bacterium TWA4]
MKLKTIKIKNFRCFEKVDIDLDHQMTLIVGKNGTGKTAILDAIAVSISAFLFGLDIGGSRSILKDDARYEFHDLNCFVDPQHQFPVVIESVGDCMDRQDLAWTRSLNSANGKTTIKDAVAITEISKNVQQMIMTGKRDLILPLLSYYGTGRLYAQKRKREI